MMVCVLCVDPLLKLCAITPRCIDNLTDEEAEAGLESLKKKKNYPKVAQIMSNRVRIGAQAHVLVLPDLPAPAWPVVLETDSHLTGTFPKVVRCSLSPVDI